MLYSKEMMDKVKEIEQSNLDFFEKGLAKHLIGYIPEFSERIPFPDNLDKNYAEV